MRPVPLLLLARAIGCENLVLVEDVVTKSDYNQIRTDMSYREVVDAIGRAGEERSSNRMEGVPGVMESVETTMYIWQNSDGTNMNPMFQNDKLIQKAQAGLGQSSQMSSSMIGGAVGKSCLKG